MAGKLSLGRTVFGAVEMYLCSGPEKIMAQTNIASVEMPGRWLENDSWTKAYFLACYGYTDCCSLGTAWLLRRNILLGLSLLQNPKPRGPASQFLCLQQNKDCFGIHLINHKGAYYLSKKTMKWLSNKWNQDGGWGTVHKRPATDYKEAFCVFSLFCCVRTQAS